MPEGPALDGDGWVGNVFIKIEQLRNLEQANPVPQEAWIEGAAPTSGPSFVVLDGFFSRSYPGRKPPYKLLLESFRPAIVETVSVANIHGFSFLGTSQHYPRIATEIDLPGGIAETFDPYRPRSGAEITYVGYSIGGLVATVGLGQFVRASVVPLASLPSLVPRLVLCQPAFDLASVVRSQIGPEEVPVPKTLLHMDLYRERLLTEIDESLQAIVNAGIDVRVLLWSGDKFIDYGEDVLAIFRRAGIKPRRVPLPRFVPKATNPFHAHCLVPHQRRFTRELTRLLAPPRAN